MKIFITDREYEHIMHFVKQNYGINLEGKKNLIQERLQNYLIKNGYTSYSQYIKKLESGKNNTQEQTALVDYLTTNHTYFLREETHFNYLRDIVLPNLVKKEQASRSIKIWSAASSTGEEPYTIMMILEDFFRNFKQPWDTRILASDISNRALNKAINGIYNNELIDILPDRWKNMYFKRYTSESCQVRDEIRKKVIFRKINLMEDFNIKSKLHVIFLRNVMIYFDDATKRKLVEKMYNSLENGGYLFIGLAEGIDKKSTPFKYIQPSIYQKSY